MTQIPDGVEQPVSAGERARVQIARLLQDPDDAARLLKLGARVVVVPRTEAMTSLDAPGHPPRALGTRRLGPVLA
ncbi:hypothetical protein [Streptomyces sp. WG7]|uniref:hypothetical protein n=1 Tax=Streptomyces sp. WG7 TaxID=3417650 RepID=UPI003CF8C310